MPHLEAEADLIMHNLNPFLRWKYHDNIMYCFTSSAKEGAINDRCDPDRKQAICVVDTNTVMDDYHDNVGYKEAIKYTLEAKKDQAINQKNGSS